MDSCKVVCFFIIIIIFFPEFLITVSSSTEFCSTSACSRGEAIIRFPFRLENRHPKPCGYPGFDLFCDGQNQTVVALPNSGNFTVQAIDYETQNLWINDPEYCLPKRLLTLNLSGLPRGVRYTLIVGAGVPAILCVVGLLCCICHRVKRFGRQRHTMVEFTSVVVPHTTITSGLDITIIESYPKIVLGESRRLAKLDDNICSICLSEYMPNETLRSIPECQHCFHAECIDEWLQMKASCPVCRSSPNSS
ncbi:unnamed protein product [Fraxinus pennsylvanica]|uniref:RING-type E3 ubiquitin transferase n=1 Tax=Fraxinus pennsylvanica TaxID=56036 RepID=A0AAD2DY28_9LAMI|nr:unnamed protein product [Fraxinus pennsylvanica]